MQQLGQRRMQQSNQMRLGKVRSDAQPGQKRLQQVGEKRLQQVGEKRLQQFGQIRLQQFA